MSRAHTAYELEEIEHSGLFDVAFYLKQVPGAANYPEGPIAHYMETGAYAGLNPNWLFNANYYIIANALNVETTKNALLHFILHGAQLGMNPHPLFDVRFYLNEYPEVAKSGINPLLHYLRIGVPDRAKPHPLFDTWFYLDQFSSSPESIENPLLQFLESWSSNHANPHPLFDMSFYRATNSDVVNSKINPLVHYVSVGAKQKRNPHPLFDTLFYVEQKPQGFNQDDNALVHYIGQTGCAGADPHPLFSQFFYRQMYPDILKGKVNPLVHYVRYGAAEKKDPSPYFDTAYYLANCSEAESSKLNPLAHYLLDGARRGYNPSPLFATSFYVQSHLMHTAALSSINDFSVGKTDVIKTNPLMHYARLGRFENLAVRKREAIGKPLNNDPPALIQIVDGVRHSSDLHLLQELARPYKHLFLLGCLMRGGAERSACHLIQFAAERAGSIEDTLVIVTDVAQFTCIEWLPEGTRIINLAESFPKLAHHDRGALLMRLIADTTADTIHVINSPRAYAAIGYYFDFYRQPSAKILSYLCGYELYADLNFSGFQDGALYHAAKNLSLMITDNDRLRKTIIERYKHVPSIESKVVTCYQPLMDSLQSSFKGGLEDAIEDSNSLSLNSSAKKGKVLWASRIDVTKRPDILFRIAQAMPDVQFDVFGYSSSGYEYSYLSRLKNIKLMGEYSDFGQIPKDDKAAFLYTSDADGMPNVLLESMAAGLPAIAPNVGGIGELITNETGWLVARFDDVDHYVRLLKYVLGHRTEAIRRAKNAQKLLNERHSWSSFSNKISALGIIS